MMCAGEVASRHITVFPLSVLHTYGPRFSLKALPVDFPSRAWPVTIVTPKHRTLDLPSIDRRTKKRAASGLQSACDELIDKRNHHRRIVGCMRPELGEFIR
jgi:hypothetical protein